MPDNWSYVFGAYALAAVAFAAYWRRLARREREITALEQRPAAAPSRRGGTEPRAPSAGHPRSEPSPRPSIQSPTGQSPQ